MNRRQFVALSASAGIGLLTGDAMMVEPNRLILSRHFLRAPGADGSRTIALVQLSDMHLHRIGAHEERIAAITNELRPDLIAITGDVIDRHDRLPLVERFLALLDPGIARVAILGNWEHWASVDMPVFERLYARNHVDLLVNRTTVFEARGARLTITGLDDLVGGTPNITDAVRGLAPSGAHIVLAHCPGQRDAFNTPNAPPPLAMISGHTHGGQVKLGAWAPFLPAGSGGYVEGWYRGAPFDLLVSRGLGMSMIPVRFCSAPELAHFTIAV